MEIETMKKGQRTKTELVEDTETDAYLPKDIILYGILPKLPIKSIFQFKLVAKKWCNSIAEDPIFATHQSQRSLASSCCILYQDLLDALFIISPTDPNLVGIPDPSLNYIPGFKQLLASTNGLICGLCLIDGRLDFYVSNPVTKDWVYVHNPNKYEIVGIAFDPLICTSHYELICPYQTAEKPNLVGFQVFSSRTNAWAISKAKPLALQYREMLVKNSVFLGGKIYWRAQDDVVWFDCKEDRAGLVPSPGEKELDSFMQIGECNSELIYNRMTNKEIEIWALNVGEFDFEWEKRYKVELEGIFDNNWKVMAPFIHSMNLRNRRALDVLVSRLDARPLPFVGGEEVMFAVKDKIGGNIFKYNLKTRKVELICRVKLNPNLLVHASYFTFKPSLLAFPS